MKLLLLFFSLALFSISAYCQLDKQYWLVGGTGNFYTFKDNYTTTGQPSVTGRLTEINLAATIGYFFVEKFVAGLQPGITSIKSHGANSASVLVEDTKIYIGPFVRYYFLDKDKQFNILVNGSYQLGSLSNFGKGTTQRASIMVGSELFFNTSVGIEFLLGYLYQKNIKDESQNGYDYTKKGFNVSIGFQIHLTNE